MTRKDWLQLNDKELYDSRFFVGDWLEEQGEARAEQVRSFRYYYDLDEPDDLWHRNWLTSTGVRFFVESQARRFLTNKIRKIIEGKK